MKTSLRLGLLLLLSMLTLTINGCGYRNPYVYNGPDKVVYVTHWKNKTNELQLDNKIYQSLTRWFQKSNKIKTSNTKEGADLILAGEIMSIQLPSLSYTQAQTSQVKVMLTIRYILKDIKTGKILIEVPSETWKENARTSSSTSLTKDNEDRALATIIDNFSEKIYMRALDKLAAE